MELNNYLELCKRISMLIKENKQKYDDYLSNAKEQISSVQYSKDGRFLHRGFFCPSKIIDIIIDNISRGKITDDKNYDYMYGFDKCGSLIFARRNKQREFIKNENGFELGITYSNRNVIEAISECAYENGNIKEYSYYVCNSKKNRVEELTIENYDYKDDSILVNRARFINANPEIKSKCILTTEIYEFKLENNQIVEYIVTKTYPITSPTIKYKVTSR